MVGSNAMRFSLFIGFYLSSYYYAFRHFVRAGVFPSPILEQKSHKQAIRIEAMIEVKFKGGEGKTEGATGWADL
jgi:hypothetical protein